MSSKPKARVRPQEEVQKAEPVSEAKPIRARIVARVPRAPTEKTRHLAGRYRVIHGSVAVPVPLSERLRPDGSENLHAPRLEYAVMGDEIDVGDADAARMLDADIIEEIDAKPSRVNKVWAPPKPIRDGRGRGESKDANV